MGELFEGKRGREDLLAPGEVTAVINIIILIMCIASTIVRHDIDITYWHDKINSRK
jgi:hypothetical protein